jgi:hypothetical protein
VLTRSSGFVFLVLSAFLGMGMPRVAYAEPADFNPAEHQIPPDGAHVLDGSCVLDIGELRVNITNHGLIGSQYSSGLTYSHAPSGEWPGGTGNEYLWGAGLWVGGRLGGELTVTTGQLDRELRPDDGISDTIYEARRGLIVRPYQQTVQTGLRLPSANSDDDHDGTYDEDMLNGIDDDGDGKVDEDFGQLGDQMFTCTMYDNRLLTREIYPEHRPLGLKVTQKAIGWDRGAAKNIVGLDYKITNIGHNEIADMYLGFYVDCDIQNRNAGSNKPDDLAGSFSGIVRGDDRFFYRAEFGYMHDGAEEDPLPGYFGVQLVNHTTAFDGITAPHYPLITSFNIFSTTAAVNQNGEPNNDNDRYYLMSRKKKDRNTKLDEKADFKFLISSGPFTSLDVGESLDYQVTLIMGDSFRDLLTTAAEAGKLFAGRWYNADNDWYTGWGGRETKVCLGDYPTPPYGDDPIMGHRVDFMDEVCAGTEGRMFAPIINEEYLATWGKDGGCIWVNMDNCTECLRVAGRECDVPTYFSTFGYTTGTMGRETHYPWTVATESPPLAPLSRIMSGDSQVEIIWDDRSELVPDPFRGVADFESYRVWRVSNWTPPGGSSLDAAPPMDAWGMIAEFDLVNEIPAEVGISTNDLPLGRNTGLDDILYAPPCLVDPRFAGLAEAMQDLVDTDVYDAWPTMPRIRGLDGRVAPGMEAVAKWEYYPDVLDTFFAVTERVADPTMGVIPKRPARYYHYIDPDTHNGFTSYYAIVARDHLLFWDGSEYLPAGYGIEEDPGNHVLHAKPRPDAQTVTDRNEQGVNIYVYPNPATRESLAEFQARESSRDDPTGVRVMFNNLPLAHNTIRIFTVSGDLLQTINHDGYSEGGAVSWNLMTRNLQEVVSGIYLYSVHSDNDGFEPFRGRFVIIR